LLLSIGMQGRGMIVHLNPWLWCAGKNYPKSA
jgi:hypothetical protein